MKPQTTRELAEHLGIAPSLLLSLKSRLTKGVHWANDPQDGRRILWSETGERAALEALGLAEAPFEPPPPEPEVIEGQVHSKASKPGTPHFPNERIVRIRDSSGCVHTVWVKSSRNFQPQLQGGAPMLVRATLRGGRLELADQRCPRWPGKW